MKRPAFLPQIKPAEKNRLAFQGGSYSLMVTAIVPGHPDPGEYTGFRAAGLPDTL